MALPPNWARYTTEDGKEYFHNAAENKTQWDKPVWNGQAPESLSFHSGTSEVYQYRPSVNDLELNPRFSDAEGRMVGMSGVQEAPAAAAGTTSLGPAEAVGKAPGGKVPTSEHETVSLTSAPSGRIGASDGPTSFGGGSGGFVGSVLSAASADDGGEQVSGIAGSLLTWAQQMFDVSSDDVIKRLRLAIMPYPPQPAGNINDFRARPDFWGPFWIATTAVLFLAATGNFARLLSMGDHTAFKADYGLVSLASMMIYGCLVGVPLLTRAALYLTGHDSDAINFRQMICVYGYSLTPTIPVSIVCLIPLESMRWLAVIIGLAVSLLFIRGNLWSDLAIEAPSLKWKLVSLFCVAQVAIFGVYRVHFFSSA